MGKSIVAVSSEWMRDQYLAGATGQQIAKDIGCHERTVYQRLEKLGVPMRKVGVTHMSEEQKQIRRDWAKAHPDHKPSLGMHHTEETKRRMSAAHIPEKTPTWKGGITKIIRALRHTKEYYQWRKLVIGRVNGLCEHCGQAKPLQAHHKVSVHKDMSLALDLNNGEALCKKCHDLADGRRVA